MRIQCEACSIMSKPSIYCHECNGVGFIEVFPKCTRNPPDCPIVDEIMTGGWICNRCGDSGPL